MYDSLLLLLSILLKYVYIRAEVAFQPEKRLYAVDNSTNGFELHRVGYSGATLVYHTGSVNRRQVPKQVRFAEHGTVVVGGSDHGKVYVFDRKTGRLLDFLTHDSKDLVQTIAVSRLIPISDVNLTDS